MLESIKSFINRANEEGLRLPFARDAANGKPSVTLLFAYISFVLAICANIYFILKDPQMGTILSITTWAIALVFYRLRSLDHVKFDLDDKSIELDGDEEKNDSTEKQQ